MGVACAQSSPGLLPPKAVAVPFFLMSGTTRVVRERHASSPPRKHSFSIDGRPRGFLLVSGPALDGRSQIFEIFQKTHSTVVL